MMEVVSCAIIDAPSDATVVFASHHAEAARDDGTARRNLYRVLATNLRVAVGLALLVAVATILGGGAVVNRLFPNYRELVPGIFLLGLALVPRALGQAAIAATKAMMHMEYDALVNGLAHPATLLVSGLVVYASGGGLTALCAAQLAVEVAVCVLAARAFARHFSFQELGRALRREPSDSRVMRFVVPQGLNLTFNRYIARLDSIMLAAFGLGRSDLGYFGTAALLTGSLAQIRMIFSGALAPVVARLHSGGQRRVLEETMGRVARWTTSLIAPVVLALVVLRGDVMRLASPDYGQRSLFVAVLLIPPFTNCAYGLAGACLMFTGWSRVTLANSLSVALLNTGLTYLLIPRYGMLGAAVATAIATSIMTGLQMIELQKLERVAIRWRAVWKPHAAFAAGLLPIAALWDPAHLVPVGRAAVVVAACAIYGAVLLALRHEELTAVLRRIRAWRLPGG
jgi:O-antigen/teichoic acid export membrane protein